MNIMNDYHLEINDIVLSSNFGLGKIVSFEKIGDADQEFAVIESLEKKVKLMAPINDNLNFRKLSNADELLEKLKELKAVNGQKDFESKKDRITYFKSRNTMQDLESILETIAQLRDVEDRGTVENKIYENLVNNIKLEVATVLDIENEKAAEIVDSSI